MVWINGNFVEEQAASISLRDAGLLHAAGLFTTMRSYGGKIFRLNQHLRRLRDSCDALFIPLTYKDDALTTAVAELLSQNQVSAGRLRLSVTRGHAIQDPIHGLRLEPNIFLTAADLEPYPADFYDRGMTVILLDEQKLNPYDIQAGHKTLNYFSRLSALREANRRGAGEALWFNVHNYLQSGSISNVFVVKDSKLLTPPTPQEMLDPTVRDAMPYPKSAVLPGITRAAIMELAHESKIEVNLASIDVNTLLEADEIFLSNSIMQIMPVCRIERRAIGNDRPGPITLDLSQRLTTLIAASV
jgi:branched-subunit amino acid aminotransferase/4-amino-4-deoxychorismate lyase